MKESRKISEDSSHQVQTIFLKDVDRIIAEIIGEEYKNYRNRWEAATNFNYCGRYPTHIDLELSYGCNLKCQMCIYSLPKELRENEPKEKLLDLELIKNLIDEGIPHGLSSIGTSVYNEPLLRKDIMEFCSWARSAGILDIIMVTNGTLLTKEISEKILDAGITKLRFSLDAFSKELYEAIRVGANYEQTMENIHNFLDLRTRKRKKLPVVSVNFVLMKENEHELESFKRYWSEYVDFIVVQNLLPLENTTVNLADTCAVTTDFKCPQPWQRVIIRSDGTVLPCTYLGKDHITIGNITDKSIYDMWNSQFMKQFRMIHKNGLYKRINACRRCVSGLTGHPS